METSSFEYDHKLFVRGLSQNVTEEMLRHYFSQFGKVSRVTIVKEPLMNRSRGFGFVTFTEAGIVPNILAMETHTLDGRHLVVKPRIVNRVRKVFVGGLGKDTSLEDLKAYMSQFGNIEEAIILLDQVTKRHRGFGFVSFESCDSVDRICAIKFHVIKGKKVECKKCKPKPRAKKVGPLVIASDVATAVTASYPPWLMCSNNTNYPYSGLGMSNRYLPYTYPYPIHNANSVTGPSGAYGTETNPLAASIDMPCFQNTDWSAFYNVQ